MNSKEEVIIMATRRRKTTARKKPTGRKPAKYVVTAKYTMKSKPVTATQKNALVKRVRNTGGTATSRKV